MPQGWIEWGAVAQIAGAVVTALLAAGTFLAAVAALRAARISERDSRASRLPVTAVTWTGCVRQGERLFTAARVRNVSRGPITLHRARTAAASVFHGSPIPMREHGGIERTLQVNEEQHIPMVLSVSDLDLARAAQGRIPVGTLIIDVVVSVFGIDDTEETWQGFGLVHYRQGQEEQFHIEARSMNYTAQDNSWYGKLKRAFQKWGAIQERWKREMNS